MENTSRPRLRRSEVPKYLMEKHGIPIAVKTLNKLASTGGGPAMTYFGRIPLYSPDDLDTWVAQKLSKPVSSTAEKDAA